MCKVCECNISDTVALSTDSHLQQLPNDIHIQQCMQVCVMHIVECMQVVLEDCMLL